MRIFKISRATPVVVNTNADRAAKTEAESNMKFTKFLMWVVLSLFMMIGSTMVALSISINSHFFNLSLYNDSGLTVTYLSVVIGVILLFLCVYGFFAVVRHSTFMVNLYAFILSMLFILQLVMVILAFTSFEDPAESTIRIPTDMYWIPEYQREIDRLQRTYACCGSVSFYDYSGMTFNPDQRVVMATVSYAGETVTLKLPESCCLSVANGQCYQVSATGCQFALYEALVQHSKVIGVIGISLMVITFLAVIFALLMARSIRKLKSVRGLLAWRVQERIIVARQAVERQQQQNQPNQEKQQQQDQPQQETKQNKDQQNHVYNEPQLSNPA